MGFSSRRRPGDRGWSSARRGKHGAGTGEEAETGGKENGITPVTLDRSSTGETASPTGLIGDWVTNWLSAATVRQVRTRGRKLRVQIAMKPCCWSIAGLLIAMTPVNAAADVCDYRPSAMIGAAASATLGTGAATVALSGATANAVGVYTLVHATSGLTMVGGTWAGASAAGTAGIIAGTGGAIGTAVAVVMAPATIIVAGASAIVVGGFEGVCYFSDTRIEDYEEIDAIVQNIAVTAPEELYQYFPARDGRQDAFIRVRDPDAEDVRFDDYDVINLYIVNGVLKHRDWFMNTTIGLIGEIQVD